MRVEAATAVDDDLCAAVERLVPQLSRTSPPPSRAVLERIVSDQATTLFVARDGHVVVGMLTLATFQIPTGVRAWIEDVVVDDAARGAGVAARKSALATGFGTGWTLVIGAVSGFSEGLETATSSSRGCMLFFKRAIPLYLGARLSNTPQFSLRRAR